MNVYGSIKKCILTNRAKPTEGRKEDPPSHLHTIVVACPLIAGITSPLYVLQAAGNKENILLAMCRSEA